MHDVCVCVRDVGGEGMSMCAAACMWQSEENSVVLVSHLNVVPGMDHLRSYLAQSIFVWGFGLVWFLRMNPGPEKCCLQMHTLPLLLPALEPDVLSVLFF